MGMSQLLPLLRFVLTPIYSLMLPTKDDNLGWKFPEELPTVMSC